MVLFGGRSGEHEVSLASARSVIAGLERAGHEVVPVGITREGRWLAGGDPLRELEASAGGKDGTSGPPTLAAHRPPAEIGSVDVVFPVLHGPYGEDGTIQGLLELAGVPYVGAGVLASAVGMDKITMKKVFAHHGLPQVRWVELTRKRWRGCRKEALRELEEELGFPCFVKPSNLGSSVGISRATDPEGLAAALDAAAELDRRIIVEAGVEAREIEVSVLGNEDPEVSVPGEIVVRRGEFYDYEAKYSEGGMELRVPAGIPEETAAEIRRTARIAYEAIDAAGMARVDFFLERGTDRVLLNEINTIPGFTATSVYSRLWEASGLPYERLLERLVELALERHAGKR
ncbi:D-alanine--D-alanine ligase family protein [Rubrobacter xylanophilus]|nr:D-alanine--D-alanine ligase family protein [Rubrobacter xylanophilus]